MKETALKILCFYLLLWPGLPTLQAQFHVDILEDTMAMSKGNKNSFSMEMKDATSKEIEKLLKKYFKEHKGDYNGKHDEEIFIDDASIERLSNNTVDLYIRLNNVGNDVKMVTWFDLGGVYLNSDMHTDKVKIAKNILFDFAKHVSATGVEAELVEAEDYHKELEDELESLVKDNDKMQAKIDKNKRFIESLEVDIAQLEIDMERKRSEISQQKDRVANLSGSDNEALDQAKKNLKKLEKEEKKLEKEWNNSHKEIDKLGKEIRELEREMENNLGSQEKKKQEITEHELVIDEIKARLKEHE